MYPVLKNVICRGELSTPEKLDLVLIASKMEGSSLNLKRFPGIIIRKHSPKGTISLFRSKKFIVLGCCSISAAECLSKKLVKDLKKVLNIDISLQKFEVTNLVATGEVGFKINIQELCQESYALKDDKYPGVYLSNMEIKRAAVFRSGKVILNGATSEEILNKAFQKIVCLLKKFREEEK